MGSILSRRIAGVEDIDIQANSAYRYPPKCESIEEGKTSPSMQSPPAHLRPQPPPEWS